jgi:Ca-activated chloride channel homolog
VPADAGAVQTAATTWSRYRTLAFQVLLLLDDSASMGGQVRDADGRATTKAALLRSCADDTVRLFGEDTSVGMWTFPSAAGGYAATVPFGPLGDPLGGSSRRGVLDRALQNFTASGRGGAPLYDTVLRGQAEMARQVRPDTVTIVFVLTDGRDAGTTSRASFVSKLRPDVPVYGLGYGPGADMTALRDAAGVTGGQAVAVSRPHDLDAAVAQMFIAAHHAPAG